MKTRILFLLAFVAMCCTAAIAQIQVKGTVVSDKDSEPMIGVAILEQGTSNGTITDVDGNFSIQVKSNATLVVSYVGYNTQTVAVNGRNQIQIRLEEDSKLLDDVVVVGYGVQKKSDLTGAVASVKADELKGLSTTDAGAALQGKASGVQVINGGAPGDGASIRVRGYSSNSGNIGPLLIVDGVKVDNIQYLDPSLIQSMEVLKDAASAAIYGAQAGNGVVIITTKSGSHASVEYSLKATMQSLGKKADLFNAKDYIDYQTYIGNLSQETLNAGGYNGQDTDWYNEFFENSWSMQHNLTIQGGNDKGHFLASLGIVNNDGIVVGSKDVYKRLTAQVNADYNFFKWLTVKSSTNIEKWSKKSVGMGYNQPLNAVTSSDPLTPAYVYKTEDMGMGMANQWATNPDYVLKPSDFDPNNPKWFGTSKYNDAGGNPLALLENNHAQNTGLTVRGSLEADIKPFKDLTITSRLGYRISQSNSHDSSSPWWLLAKNVHSESYSISASTNAGLYYQWENFANYNKQIGKHNINAMIGMSFTKDHNDNSSISSSSTEGPVLNGDGASNFNYINYLNDLGMKNLSVSNAPSDVTSLSYFGRLAYSYDNRYSVQANFRRDAFSSEKLSKDARWGNFPSFSAGWTISNEEFFKEHVSKSAVSFLKLRASWGRNGNVAPLSGYQYASTIGVGGYYQFVNGTLTTGAAPGKMPNTDLQWETSEQLDFGLDARFLDDRLTLGLDWYKKTTKDLLLQITGIPEIGGQSQWVNTGKVLNQGLDIELGWKDHAGDLNYGISTNFSPLKNEVQEVSSVYPRILQEGVSGFNNKLQPCFEKGHEVWYFRGFDYAGVDPQTGAALYYDKNGEITNAPTDDDKKDLGSAIPTFTYGVTINLEYKGFDLTVFGTGAAGNKIYNLMVSADTPKINGINTYWKDSWKQAGDNSKYPDMAKVATDWTFFSSSAAVYDGSYFKFKQIQLGYTLPKNLTKKALISNARVSVSLDDYFVITSYPGADPEVSSSATNVWSRGFDNGTYPMPKKVVFGLNLTF